MASSWCHEDFQTNQNHLGLSQSERAHPGGFQRAADKPNLNWSDQERDPTSAEPKRFDQSPAWQLKEIPLGDGCVLVLDDS
ncbi:MAG: hypothetical protein ACI9NC_006449 [Verrucomicrobiales bacterium]|jgi:hypothetical protein